MHRFLAALLALLCLGRLSAHGQNVQIQSVSGRASLTIDAPGILDLSGITWIEGDVFATVSDKRNVVQYVRLEIDPSTGQLIAGELGKALPLKGDSRDFEGIAWVASEKAFYLASEKLGAVVRAPASGAEVRRLTVPAVFAGKRPNLGLESLTWNGVAKHFWIANEEALKGDGPLSAPQSGSWVRLQKLDSKFRPVAQYAWRTEPASFRYAGAGNGVSDLCLLPDGQLLVMERGFGFGGLQVRLFLADFRDATDITKIPALAEAQLVPAKKSLLFEEATGFTNFEGVTLGPELAEGWRSLMLVADSNGASTHTFRALKIRMAARKR